MILNDGLVPQIFYGDEAFFDLNDVLLLHNHNLNRVLLFSRPILASMHACICSLPNHLLQHVFLVERVDCHLVLLLVLVRVLP